MYRTVYDELCAWKNKNNRKPLILSGARQVGKTWILKEFGNAEFDNLAYINCDKVTEMQNAFTDFDTDRLIRFFSVVSNTSIQPGKTLIVLDEIQEVPIGLTALKYFCENASQYHIVVAGSLLGLELHKGTGFPVGKVDEINMYPLSFKEFLIAMGKDSIINLMDEHRWEELSSLSKMLIELLRQYYYVGGMPEVVKNYVADQDILQVRKTQKQILADYRRDFSKHVPSSLLPKVNMVWDSIPSQLAKENKKFIYGLLKKGGRAKEFEDAIQWLINAGLVYKVNRVSKIESPLKFYEDISAFKLFTVDLGLLGAMVDVPAKEVLINDNMFIEYKGAFTEQYVLQEIIEYGLQPYYYSKENSRLEIDLIVQTDEVYPIEVKAEENLKSKCLKTVYDENPKLKAVRFSMCGYKEQDWMTNVPLYLSGEWLKSIC